MELLKLEGGNYCGGTADIWKYFDRIARPLVYKMAETAGMPKQVLDTYKRFQEDLSVHNSLAIPYTRKCSIPQGRPLSMMIVALLMRPWIMMMKEMNVEPKVLADDVMIIAKRHEKDQKTGKCHQRHTYIST